MKYYLIFLLCCLSCYSLTAQPDPAKIDFHLNAEVHGEQHYYKYYSPIRLPTLIKDIRRGVVPASLDTVTDNPLKHGSMYAVVRTRTTIGNIVTLNADLYGEYRGFSYGSFDKNNTVVYPVITASLKDSFRLGRNDLHIQAVAGQFLNEEMDERLMVYNLDLLGTRIAVRYKNSLLAFRIYGDMSNYIGLNIDDLNAFSYTHFFAEDSVTAGFSYVMAAPSFAPVKRHTYYNLFGHLHSKKGSSYYAQLSFTQGFAPVEPLFRGADRQMAGIVGMEIKAVKRKWSLHNRTELRYYGSAYNIFHHDRSLRYRDSSATLVDMYANTIGEYLYPLRKFNTPFSQWAVFTEYGFYNVWAASVNGDLAYQLNKKISLQLDYDINAIHARLDKYFDDEDKVSNFIYPFFKMAARYYPVQGVYISFFISNKTMNLDTGFPTQYLVKRPFAGLEFSVSY